MSAKRRPQGDGTIRKRVDGRWEGRIIIGHKSNGMPIYKSVFGKTQKATLAELHKLIDQYQGVDLSEKCRMTLGEWLDKWLDEYMIFTIRENTLARYRNMVDNQVKPYIGNKRLTSLTTVDIQKLYTKLKNEGRIREHPIHGRQLSDSMVRGVHMMLHQALEMAVTERLIVKNPTKGTTIPKKNYAEKQILCDSQLEIFKEAIKKEPYWSDLFYVEIMTGLRKGELCGLKWSDIDFILGTMCIRRSVSKTKDGIVIGETKTDAGVRKIILPPSVIELLQRKKQEATSEWIFPHYANPNEPMHPEVAYRKLKTILKNAGLPLIRFHDLRHTFATMALENGIDIKTLSSMIGHVSSETTLNIYSHVTDTMRVQASVKIDREIGGTSAKMPEAKDEPRQPQTSEIEENFEPWKPKVRKSGTGCVYQINDHLWEGSYFPRLSDAAERNSMCTPRHEKNAKRSLPR